MRININKIVAFAIGISVMSGSIMPAFAADTTNAQVQAVGKQVLTLDDAIKAAISNSDTLVLDEKKITYQNKINDTNEDLDDYNEDNEAITDDKKDLNEDTRDNTLKQLEQTRDFDQDILIQKTTTAYNGIVTSQKQIDQASKELEVKNKELNDANLKNSLGIITTTDLTTTNLDIEKLQNDQKSSQNTLNDLEYNFKVLIGKDVSQYGLEQDIKYDAFKMDGSIDEYLDNSIDSYLKYTEQLVKLNKDYYNDDDNEVSVDDVNKAKDAIIKDEPAKPSDIDTNLISYEKYAKDTSDYNKSIANYTGALSARLTYLNTKLGVYTNETTLNETKKSFKEQLRSFYTKLLTTEDSINLLKKNIELNNKQLSNAKLRSDLGIITKSDYNTLVVSSEDLELQLRSAIDSYNTLKEQIQKPWIAFS